MAPSKKKTRSKESANIIAEAVVSTAQKVTLAPQSLNPPKVFIMPKDATDEARIVTLAHPRTGLPSRYLSCPRKGFYEFTKVGAPRTTPRSWLLAPDSISDERNKNAKVAKQNIERDGISQGYVTKAADIFITTPVDPIFFVLPVLAPQPRGSESKKRMFLAADDYFDTLVTNSPHFRPLLRNESTRKLVESRMAAICDTVDAGEIMYRLSEPKLLSELVIKAQKVVEGGLPASMEEKLVRKALEVPIHSLKRGESFIDELAEEELSEALTPVTESNDSQTTFVSTDTAASFVSTAATSFSDTDAAISKPTPAPIITPEGVPHLLRLRTVLDFITSSYLPSHLASLLKASFHDASSPNNFSTLDAHLENLSNSRKQAQAARSLGDFSHKRSMNEDGEANESRAEKKRKLEEGEKRKKAGESRGVRDLKKVNVSGMKKMSDFFKKT